MRKTDSTQDRFERGLDRIVCEDDRWFVRTREGLRGPFSKRRIAEAEARLFVETMEYLEQAAALPMEVNRDDITVVDMDHLPWR